MNVVKSPGAFTKAILSLILSAILVWLVFFSTAYVVKPALLVTNKLFSFLSHAAHGHKGTFVSIQLAPEGVRKKASKILLNFSDIFINKKYRGYSHSDLAQVLTNGTPFKFKVYPGRTPYSEFYPKAFEEYADLAELKKQFASDEDYQWFGFIMNQAYWRLQPSKPINSPKDFFATYSNNFKWMAHWVAGNRETIRGYDFSDKVDKKALLFSMTYGIDGFIGKHERKMTKDKAGFTGDNPGLSTAGKQAANKIYSSQNG